LSHFGAGVVQATFTGHEYDEENSLQYGGARYLDNQVGRFISIDPLMIDILDAKKYNKGIAEILSNPQDLNSYSYVANNPVVYVDPNGKAKIYIRLAGPWNANKYNPTNWEEWGGHSMVEVDGTYYGFAPTDNQSNDLQEFNQKEFEENYDGQRWKVVDIGNDYDTKITENFEKLKDGGNQEYGTYSELSNNCTQKLWDILAVSGVWDKNNMAPRISLTPDTFYEGLKWINRYENIRGFFDKSYDSLIKDIYNYKVDKEEE